MCIYPSLKSKWPDPCLNSTRQERLNFYSTFSSNCWSWDCRYCKNKTKHSISSNSHPSAIAKKAIHNLKRGRGLQKQGEYYIIDFKCKHLTVVSENSSSSVMLIIWLANRGRLLLRTPGPVPFGTCICSYVETILSWTCHVYGPYEFRTSLGTSILP